MNNNNYDFSELAEEFITALKTLVHNEDNIENFKYYLNHHFSEWLTKFANTPEGITAEVKAFATMNINSL